MNKIAYKVKLALLVGVSVFSLTSCSITYKFCQVYETKPLKAGEITSTDNGGQKYENDHCVITYYFWSNYGSSSFDIYNKSEKIIYIDLAKSFFIRNGVAYDLYKAREWSESNTSGYSEGYGYGYLSTYSVIRSRSASISGLLSPTVYGLGVEYTNASKGKSVSSSSASSSMYSKQVTRLSSHSSSVTIKESQIIAVPPHSRKNIVTYAIVTAPMLSCALKPYPEHNARLSFTPDNSPIIFSNYITYTIDGDNRPHAIENGFYVSTITNYAEPDAIEYKKRQEPCENLKGNSEYASRNNYGRSLYDKVMRPDICEFSNSFYLMYETTSSKRLYKTTGGKAFVYDSEYNAYTEYVK